MARSLRIEFKGALYHLTSRGDGREDIYVDDIDRKIFLSVLCQVCDRYNWVCHGYCLMNNHYHLLVETPEGNLSQGMRQLNGVYTQRFNRRHQLVGHVFQGRYKSILVDKSSYLLELARYIVLNPVRAGIVQAAHAWPWSSYHVTAGLSMHPQWLEVNWLLSLFGSHKKLAMEKYRAFVAQGKGLPAPWHHLKKQIYLGDDNFVDEMQSKIVADVCLDEIPRCQKRPVAKPLSHYTSISKTRNEAIHLAFLGGGYSMKKIADHFELHYSSVSKILNDYENSRFKT